VRNLSSHTYREALAEEVYEIAQALPIEAAKLVEAIERAK